MTGRPASSTPLLPEMWFVPCIRCGRERAVWRELWIGWLHPCLWCARVATDAQVAR